MGALENKIFSRQTRRQATVYTNFRICMYVHVHPYIRWMRYMCIEIGAGNLVCKQLQWSHPVLCTIVAEPTRPNDQS